MAKTCPNKTKFRRVQKGKMTGLTKGASKVSFGEYGIKALDRGRVTANQIEACRVAISRECKKKGKPFIRIFPDKPISKKPAETRMGKGKGAPDHWVALVRPGRVMFEIGGVPFDQAQKALRNAAAKLPFRTKMVQRQEEG